jgi:hypothetical protein
MDILNKDLKKNDDILLICGSGRKCLAPVTVMRLIRKKANLQNHEDSKIIEFDSRLPLS